jgi:hypothetical protein
MDDARDARDTVEGLLPATRLVLEVFAGGFSAATAASARLRRLRVAFCIFSVPFCGKL